MQVFRMLYSFIYQLLSIAIRSKYLSSLEGHQGPITCLTFSPNGKYLAVGGTSCLRIWDLGKKQVLSISPQSYFERSQISALCWVSRTQEGFDILCYGNAKGYLVFLIHRPSECRFEVLLSSRVALGGEITCLAVIPDPSYAGFTRIALGTRDKCLQVFRFSSDSKALVPIHSIAYDDRRGIVPKAIAFDNNGMGDLYVFGLYDGGLYRYHGNDMTQIAKHQLGSQIGNAGVDIDKKLCVIDNVRNGFAIYRMDSGSFMLDMTTREATQTLPKQVTFGSNSKLVIGGSDHGKIYIFEQSTGRLLRSLKHARKGGVETIATHDNDDGSVTIASASSSVPVDKDQSIHIWKWHADRDGSQWRLKEIFDYCIKIVAILLLSYMVFILHHIYTHRPEDMLERMPKQAGVSVKSTAKRSADYVGKFFGFDLVTSSSSSTDYGAGKGDRIVQDRAGMLYAEDFDRPEDKRQPQRTFLATHEEYSNLPEDTHLDKLLSDKSESTQGAREDVPYRPTDNSKGGNNNDLKKGKHYRHGSRKSHSAGDGRFMENRQQSGVKMEAAADEVEATRELVAKKGQPKDVVGTGRVIGVDVSDGEPLMEDGPDTDSKDIMAMVAQANDDE